MSFLYNKPIQLGTGCFCKKTNGVHEEYCHNKYIKPLPIEILKEDNWVLRQYHYERGGMPGLFFTHFCSSLKNDWSVSMDLNLNESTICWHCAEEIPQHMLTIYRLYSKG